MCLVVYGFVDFSFVQCVAVLNVFVGAKACFAVGHHGQSWQAIYINSYGIKKTFLSDLWFSQQ
jgi:hypothetical protein